MEFNISDLQEVEQYIRGELNQNEIDALWVKFLQDPALYRYFDIQLHIKSLVDDVQAGRTTSLFTD